MAYTAGNLHLRPGAPGDLIYNYDAGSDTMATCLVVGYFNNSDDDLNLTADDSIFVRATDGNCWLRVASISSGSVTCEFMGGDIPIQTQPSSGTAIGVQAMAVGYYDIGTSISTGTRMVLPRPYPGAVVHVTKADTGTRSFLFHAGGSVGASAGTIPVGSTGVTYDAEGNRVITLRVEGESFHVVASSTSRWRIQNMHYVSSLGSCASNTMVTAIGTFIGGS